MQRLVPVMIFLFSITVFSCKGKDGSASVDTTAINSAQPVDTTTLQSAPVQISPNDSLTTMVEGTVKDYAGVKATVSNGEITLTGNITREKLPKLMEAVNALHPKKVNNKLTVK